MTDDSTQVERLMHLLAELTGWGDQSLSVEIGYKRATDWIAQDESRLNNDNWGFTAKTTICGAGTGGDNSIRAQGKTLDAALLNLADEVLKVYKARMSWWLDHLRSAEAVLDKFDATHEVHAEGPYR